MTFLLDTHTFLWFVEGSPRLSLYARSLIETPTNTRLVSVGSLWEMAIKCALGKLELKMSFLELVEQEVYGNGMRLLSIEPSHLDRLVELPFHHRDPFDRLLIAQGFAERIPLVSHDSAFDAYEVERLWQK